MVTGLKLFSDYFRAYSDQYVLIGGSACDLLFENAGMEFRRTRDLDIVLCIEVLILEFTTAFSRFIVQGGYKIKEKSTGKRVLYRFTHPEDKEFPVQIELFSARALGVTLPDEVRYTPIKISDQNISLSALLMDDAYYSLITNGKTMIEEMPVLKPEYLLVFKAKAWLDLSARQARGEKTKATDIAKHVEDVYRLIALLNTELRIELSPSIQADMQEFVKKSSETPISNYEKLDVTITQLESLQRIQIVYGL